MPDADRIFYNFRESRSSLLNYIEFGDLRILKLENWKTFGHEAIFLMYTVSTITEKKKHRQLGKQQSGKYSAMHVVRETGGLNF